MKVLEVDSLLAGIHETSNQLSILKDQVSQVQVSIQELVSLEDAFKGQGGQAIRAFYQECHQPFLQFLESWIDEYRSYLKSFIGSLGNLEPSPSGFIRQEFLEHELQQGLRNTLQITAELTEEANEIMKSVSDIVALPRLEVGRFIQATKSAEDSSRETVQKLEDFDHRETAALDPILHDLNLMNQYIQKIAGMFQSSSLSLAQYQPKSLNWKDFHEEISNPNPEIGQSVLQDIAEGAIEGASKAVGDTWDGLKSTYELGRTIMGPFSPLFLGSELLFNRDQLLENQRKHQEFYLGILNDPIGKVSQALDMPKYIWSAVTSAWERDVISGDVKSRTAFFTYGLTSLGIGILGDKGIGKAGTVAKTVRQAGKGEKALPIYTPIQRPALAGGLVQRPVPYNVLHDPLTQIKTVTEKVYGVKGTKDTVKIDYDLAKNYIRDVESKTGLKLHKRQIEKLKDALRDNKYEKMTPLETIKHRSKFNGVKNKLIDEWEVNTGQTWPRYTEEIYDKKGRLARDIGQPYDAHHIIENNFGGPHEWWNIHPAKFPDEHQAGIHGKGSPSNKLFPRR
ncbi:ribonuclease YeeF family protein [Cytobacillus oceanisediminis]|uniref:ribonuclease YeeF family protein n=1 Tax=Cytobacillus oceanisediminis TaxID=665099 RepID=UPI00203AB1FF|nr:T7SS effector LXG polymorphic toxin [Cytobacillus oceanisediminis]MCM3391842.1 LXG domain-containing protein [Cytobacillus oceanisediminis]